MLSISVAFKVKLMLLWQCFGTAILLLFTRTSHSTFILLLILCKRVSLVLDLDRIWIRWICPAARDLGIYPFSLGNKNGSLGYMIRWLSSSVMFKRITKRKCTHRFPSSVRLHGTMIINRSLMWMPGAGEYTCRMNMGHRLMLWAIW